MPTPRAALSAADALDEKPDAVLPPLVWRSCQALEALVTSLDALESVLLRLQRLAPASGPPTGGTDATQATVLRVIALLQAEGPPLLLRAQALRHRLRQAGFAAGKPDLRAMRELHADFHALADFRIDEAPHWVFIIRRLRSNATILLAEFEPHRSGQAMPASPPIPPLATAAAPLAASG